MFYGQPSSQGGDSLDFELQAVTWPVGRKQDIDQIHSQCVPYYANRCLPVTEQKIGQENSTQLIFHCFFRC